MNGDRLTGQEQKIGLNLETVQFQDTWGKFIYEELSAIE